MKEPTQTTARISDLLKDMRHELLLPRPAFQRRSVWNTEDKARFIDTVLRSLPFPEVYVADGELDIENVTRKRFVVDGQQRLSTLFEYRNGSVFRSKKNSVPAFSELTEEQQRRFLMYPVAVRDLGDITEAEVRDIFRRINSTSYDLNAMEINNAVYGGELKEFCSTVASLPFFEDHRVFRPQQIRRMGDVKYILTVVVTMLDGYNNRDDGLEENLARYSDSFDCSNDIYQRIQAAISAIEDMNFETSSRIFKQADLFTALIEIDKALTVSTIDVSLAGSCMKELYSAVDSGNAHPAIQLYRKCVLQAANDRMNRIRRGLIVEYTIGGFDFDESYKQTIKQFGGRLLLETLL